VGIGGESEEISERSSGLVKIGVGKAIMIEKQSWKSDYDRKAELEKRL